MHGGRETPAWRKLLHRLAVLVTVGITVVAGWSLPAQATRSTCTTLLGSLAADNYIYVCAETYWANDTGSSRFFQVNSRVRIGPKMGTTALRCAVTLYGHVDAAGSEPWAFPSVGRDCTYALQNRGSAIYQEHYHSGTSATDAVVSACVYLYFNASGTPGWTQCMEAGWQHEDAP